MGCSPCPHRVGHDGRDSSCSTIYRSPADGLPSWVQSRPSRDEQVRPREYMPHLHPDTPDTSPEVGEEAGRDWEEYSRMFQSVPASRTSKVRSSR